MILDRRGFLALAGLVAGGYRLTALAEDSTASNGGTS